MRFLFATSEATKAFDGNTQDGVSPFTRELINLIPTHLEVNTLMRRVRKELKNTGAIPDAHDKMEDDFYFVPRDV